jgi:class 3 adenylate cyclase
MELIEDLDPEEARAIVDPALKLMMEAVQRYSGYVAQSTGDGIFALFGAPIAHEDHPRPALLQVRVGANTGEVVVRETRAGEKHAESVIPAHQPAARRNHSSCSTSVKSPQTTTTVSLLAPTTISPKSISPKSAATRR